MGDNNNNINIFFNNFFKIYYFITKIHFINDYSLNYSTKWIREI
jgi:hypothetical protein